MMTKKWIILIGYLPLLMSCDSSTDSEFEHYISMRKMRQWQFQESIPSFKPPIKFSYPNNYHRNPFKFIKTENQRYVYKETKKWFLKEYTLSALKFVGLMQSASNTWALFKSPDMKITYAQEGDYIGKDNVELIKIKKNMLVFEEKIFVEGKWQQKPLKVFLKQKDRG
ncbi:pilus assembly protein PilP [Legionella cardiaca]|uniref:Pilus assembly protein PilP n=1 Tax=Legionella cardiaca TaxID=1071983 RepID=A0ABY8AWP1_9GAMM|nr:pilus assembly protein PilP [Legionella cardiaca]WED43836.1 pilus assembly protein PilP [Legionella cardiaca]